MASDHILRLDVAQHPSTAVEVHTHGPASLRLVSQRREASQLDIRSRALLPRDHQVDRRSNFLQRPGTGDQNTAGSRRRDGLQVDLLLVEDVGVVEGRILGVDTVDNGGVERVGGLVVRHDDGCGRWWEGWERRPFDSSRRRRHVIKIR